MTSIDVVTESHSRETPGGRRELLVVALILGAGLAVGLALRVTVLAAWWPIGTTLGDSGPYAYFASGVNPLTNPQHPPGYSLFLALVGVATRDIAVVAIFQALLGIAAAFMLFAGVWRLCGSPWPGVVAAMVLLLGADQLYLEHTIMSESIYVFMLACSVYVTARLLDAPESAWPWPVIAAVLLFATAATRSAGLVLIPVVAIALVLAQPRPWLARWRPVAAFLATAGVLLFVYAAANEASTGRFEVAPTGGWHLYGRVAPFADCGQFTPPAGTRGLCERTDPEKRLGADHYLYDSNVPAKRVFGPRPFDYDDKLGAFGRAAVLSQPKTYVLAVWNDASAYFFPGSFAWAPGRGSDLDGQLDWTGPINRTTEREVEEGLETYFFNDFAVDRDPEALDFLHSYQRVARFGATALTVAAVLILAGLLVGSRRRRIAVLVLGVGGLATILVPTVSVIYIARYTVPPAPLIAAAATVAMSSLLQAIWRTGLVSRLTGGSGLRKAS